MASASSPETLLQSALIALKQKDYGTAIATFSTLQHHGNASTAQRLKAEMGLVRAYVGQGETATAIALCERLRQRPQPQVQAWASRMLADLPVAATPDGQVGQDASGFRPLAANSGPTGLAEEARNASGFRPLTADGGADVSELPPLTPPQSTDPSGFVPLADDPAPPVTPSPSVDSLPPATAAPVAPPPPAPPTADPSAPSLFHYASLNQAGMAAATETTEAADAPVTSPPTQLQSTPQLPAQTAPEVKTDGPGPDAAPPTESDPPWQLPGAGRLERLRSLGANPGRLQLWVTQLVTLGLSLGLMDWLLHRSLRQSVAVLRHMNWLVPPGWLGWMLGDYSLYLAIFLAVLLLASPWLWDGLMGRAYGQKSLSIQTLKSTHPEAARTLRRICQQQGWTLPHLRSLPTDTPLIFSYGWLPRNTRIVVSQGWLQRLEDDEATTLLSHELAHLRQWTLPLMSMLGLVLQGWYQVYWQVARWGDLQTFKPLTASAALISAVGYGLYWLLRKPVLALARTRTTTSDRQAVEWTGNPNGLIRALVKTAAALATDITAQGQVPPLVDSVDLLTPLGYRGALTPGSLYPQGYLPQVLTWDWQNPYRHWLTLNSSHPLLGDRLITLSRYAVQWGLEPEFPLMGQTARVRMRSKVDFSQYWLPFLLQIAPYLGPTLGIAIALLMWFVGGLVNPLGLWQISWFYGDLSLLWGSLWLGLGIGILLRINRYFPDINPTNIRRNAQLDTLVKNPMGLPTDSVAVRLQGILVGRRGMANWLCQDFWLQTDQGLLKLHFLSSLGAAGNLLIHPGHPSLLLGKEVRASGWFRRGADPWLDLDSLMLPRKSPLRAHHPAWSAGLALVSCALGILIIFRGG
jgi:Zn-dependent protease with chaperone function